MRASRVRVSAWLAVVTMIVLALASPWLFPMAGEHNKGKIHVQPDWPGGIGEILNVPERTGGVWVNANDFFYFSGETEAFNRFLEGYAKLPDVPLRVVIHRGEPPLSSTIGGQEARRHDWTLALIRDGWGEDVPAGYSGKYVTRVEVWVGERIELERMHLFGRIAPLVAR